MRTPLAGLFIMLLLLCPFALAKSDMSAANQSKEPAAHKTGKPDDSNQPIVIQCPCSGTETAQNHNPDNPAGKSNPHNAIDWINAFSTGIIALFTGALFWGIFYQANNTRAVERAWLVAEPLNPPPRNLLYASYDRPTALSYTLSFRNQGRTPGRITESSAYFGLLPSLPDTPVYRDEDLTQEYPDTGLLVVPNEIIHVHLRFMDGKQDLQPFEILDIRAGGSLLVLYGFVRYQDAFRRKHELRFCYPFKPRREIGQSEFKMAGPPAYNSHT